MRSGVRSRAKRSMPERERQHTAFAARGGPRIGPPSGLRNPLSSKKSQTQGSPHTCTPRRHLFLRLLCPTALGASRLILCAALLFLAACGDGPVFTKLFTTEHFVYYVEEGAAPPCDGTDQWLERYYNANASFLGATLPHGVRIVYYLARSEETLQWFGCPPGASCTDGTTIRSTFPVNSHEIVHANASLLGMPPFLFAEGLADILSCMNGIDTNGPLDIFDPVEQLVETEAFIDWRNANPFSTYTASASFVRHLIDTFGSLRFLSFYSRAPWNGSRQEIEDVFRAEFGESLDDAFADWRTKPAPYAGDLCLRLMDCDPSMPPLVNTDVSLGCGPLGGFGGMRSALLRFEIPKEHILRIATEPAQTEPQVLSTVSFYRCAGGDAVGVFSPTAPYQWDADRDLHVDPMQPGSVFALDVPPGEYVAWIQANAEARVDVDVEEAKSPMRKTACQAAEEPLALDHERQTTLTSRWIDRPCDGPWCPGQGWDVSIGPTGGLLEAQPLIMNQEANISPHEIYICSEPCPQNANQCEILALDTAYGVPARSTQTFEPGTVLHLGAPAAPYAGYSAVRLRVAPE